MKRNDGLHVQSRGERVGPRGKPFTGKNDPRNGKNGSLSNAAAIYTMSYKNSVVERMPPDQLAKIITNAAKRGRVWAIQLLHDDMVGKPAQPITGPEGGPMVMIMSRPGK